MFRFVSITLLLCFTLPALAEVPQNGLAYEVEPLLQDIAPLRNLTADQLSKLSIGDPLLRLAYANLMASELMLQIYSRSQNINYSLYPAWDVAALEDLRKRGDVVTPVLLDIATKNSNSGFETGVIGNAPYVIKDLNPYLEYARNVLQTRTMEMNSSVAGTLAELLVRRGTPDDLERLRNLIKARPYLTATIEGQLRHAATFQAAKETASNPKTRVAPQPVQQPILPKNAPSTSPTSTPSEEPASSTPWSIILVLIVAALGLLWLLLKRRS